MYYYKKMLYHGQFNAMNQKVLLITPPFTQLNTPYPATPYLKGFLNTKGIPCFQADLGIEVILSIFSHKGLKSVFDLSESAGKTLSENAKRILRLKSKYLQTIDSVIAFLQGKDSTLAHAICSGSFLPEASRFTEQNDDLDWAFGAMGLHDKARHLATKYLEDISDLIIEVVDPQFGFSRYAESLGRCATDFDAIDKRLNEPDGWIDQLLIEILKEKIEQYKPTLVGLAVPFPGNLLGALKCGQYIKANYPDIKIAMGGGFPNTELRTLREKKVFNYVDYICLDDGEATIDQLIKYLDGNISEDKLKRTFMLHNDEVKFFDCSYIIDYAQNDTGTPDYSDLPLNKYLSVIEMANPMHSLWSNGRWNKLTLAHGCYWGKCSFCDTTLDYIKRYKPNTAAQLCDRIEKLIAETDVNGFHFVDEAAPPNLLKELSIEILKRGLRIIWWTNVRFEKSYTYDLCRLMKAAGCIAVSGGLEVASDRLLALINKGVTVAQVAQVTHNLTENGIMVHAYLMYGFPSQTERETIDSLEMVRQLFDAGVVQSAFWHLFTMTAHSPIGQNPSEFGVTKTDNVGDFANNDIVHQDPTGAEHIKYGDGLRKALYNYMHDVGFDLPLQKWFDFKVPPTTIPPNYIEKAISGKEKQEIPWNKQLIWLCTTPTIRPFTKNKKGKQTHWAKLLYSDIKYDYTTETTPDLAQWLTNILTACMPESPDSFSVKELKESFEEKQLGDFTVFWNSRTFQEFRENGLLII